jgi:hypothetical protein
MYNLLVEGVRDLSRYTALLQQRKVAHDPLSGIVDGSNTVFYTQYAPVLTSGSLLGYASGSLFAVATMDYDTGCVEFTTAPAKQPDATYTYTPFTQSQQVSMLMAGYDELSSRWLRENWYLSSGSAVLTLPTDTDPNIWLVYSDASGSVLTDPACGATMTFSTSRLQVRLYMACCEYSYLTRQLVETSLSGVSFRERFGTALDRMQIPKNLSLALDRLESNLTRILRVAQEEYYDGTQYGSGIAPEHSVGYKTQFDWHANQEYPTVSDGDLRWL